MTAATSGAEDKREVTARNVGGTDFDNAQRRAKESTKGWRLQRGWKTRRFDNLGWNSSRRPPLSFARQGNMVGQVIHLPPPVVRIATSP